MSYGGAGGLYRVGGVLPVGFARVASEPGVLSQRCTTTAFGHESYAVLLGCLIARSQWVGLWQRKRSDSSHTCVSGVSTSDGLPPSQSTVETKRCRALADSVSDSRSADDVILVDLEVVCLLPLSFLVFVMTQAVVPSTGALALSSCVPSRMG